MFKLWLIKFSDDMGKCTVCQSFTIKHDGVGSVKQHMNSTKHKTSSQQSKQNQLISNFLQHRNNNLMLNKERNSAECDLIALYAVPLVYHTVKHHHSYNSANCFTKKCQSLLS